MAEIVPFKRAHLGQLELTERDTSLMAGAGFDPIPNFEAGPAFSLVDGEKVIAIAGIALLWKGVGEAWVIAGKDIQKYRLTFHRGVREMLSIIEEHERLHRVQTAVLENFAKGHKWIRRLGFVSEGKMKGYGPNGETFVRYARVK